MLHFDSKTNNDGIYKGSSDISDMRHYQKEVYYEALHQDSIIFLPTGAGKTVVAAHIAKTKANMFPEKKIVFIVNRVALVLQQADVFRRIMGCSVETVSGPKKSVKSWNDFYISNSKLLVIIDSVFYQWIFDNSKAIKEEISLIIFDEVHNALGGFPKKLMKAIHQHKPRDFYMPLPDEDDDNSAEERQPQILGLTASPVCSFVDGKSLSELLAVTRCRIVRVKREIDDLEEKVPIPRTIGVEYKPCVEEETFRLFLRNIALLVHNNLKVKKHKYLKKLVPSQMASPAYINKCEQLRETAIQNNNYDLFSYGIATFLLYVSKAIITLDEVSLLQAYQTVMHETVFESLEKNSEASNIILPLLNGVIEQMETIRGLIGSKDKKNNYVRQYRSNIMEMSSRMLFLMQLLEWVSNSVEEKGSSVCGIIFCDTRSSACRIIKEIQKIEKLNTLYRPKTFFGKGKTIIGEEDSRMTDAQQREVLKEFHAGQTRLLIATSVVEEGLDVAMCNLVIRYDSCVSLRSFIQSRGRARLPGALYIIMEHMRRPVKVSVIAPKAIAMQEYLVETIGDWWNNGQQQHREPWENAPEWWLQRFVQRTGADMIAEEKKHHHMTEEGTGLGSTYEIKLELKDRPNKVFFAAGTGNIKKARRMAQQNLCRQLAKDTSLDFTNTNMQQIQQRPLRFLANGFCVCQTSSMSVEEVVSQYAPEAIKVTTYDENEWKPELPSNILRDEVRRRRVRPHEIFIGKNPSDGVKIHVWWRTSTGELLNKEVIGSGENALQDAALQALKYLGVVFLKNVPSIVERLLTDAG